MLEHEHLSSLNTLRGRNPLGWIVSVAVFLAMMSAGADAVELIKTPNGGMQPRAVVDGAGKLHLVYSKVKGKIGDLFYVTREPSGTEWSEPIRVNSEEGAVRRSGMISMPQIALGVRGRIHVTWFEMKGGKYWYTRLDDKNEAFEPQRNLVTENNDGVEIGAALTADTIGNIYVVWHAGKLRDESKRRVFIRHSIDGGETFSPETRIDSGDTGVCGCCALSTLIDNAGTLYISYRAAGDNIHRDMTLLKSTDGGKSFSQETIDPWELNGCPVTTTTLTADSNIGALVGWESKELAYFANIADLAKPISVGPPPSDGRQKCLALTRDKDGRTLVTWMEGPGWRADGVLHWKIFDSDGTPTDQEGRLNAAVSRPNAPQAITTPNGRFLIVH